MMIMMMIMVVVMMTALCYRLYKWDIRTIYQIKNRNWHSQNSLWYDDFLDEKYAGMLDSHAYKILCTVICQSYIWAGHHSWELLYAVFKDRWSFDTL
jgi:hypothetical protein